MQIKLENLCKKFENNVAVDHVNITFEEGKLTALLGPSGCGKSTILNMIAGIVEPSEGTIMFGNENVEKVPMEKRGVGMVFQNYSLYPHMTIRENIRFPLDNRRNLKKPEREEKVYELAKLARVEDFLDRHPAQLSGGQQQRVAIARALAKEPKILLLDEPLSNLDARLRLEMREEIRRIQTETHVTTVFVTHDQEEALSISDRIVLLKNGVIQQEADPQQLYDDPANIFAASFLGSPPICLVNCTVHSGLLYTDNGPEIKTELCAGIEDGKKVVLGVRAEALRVVKNAETSALTAAIENKYIIGRDAMAVINVGDSSLRLYLQDENMNLSVGDNVPLGFRSKGVYIFDCENGQRLV